MGEGVRYRTVTCTVSDMDIIRTLDEAVGSMSYGVWPGVRGAVAQRRYPERADIPHRPSRTAESKVRNRLIFSSVIPLESMLVSVLCGVFCMVLMLCWCFLVFGVGV